MTEWTLFVSPFREAPSSRNTIPNQAGPISLPAIGWSCAFSNPTRVALDGSNWTERRSIECRAGEAFVVTEGFCQIAGAAWAARAAVLSVGPSADERLQITLDCTVVPPAPAAPAARPAAR